MRQIIFSLIWLPLSLGFESCYQDKQQLHRSLITVAYLPFGSFPPSNISAHIWWVPAIAIHRISSSWIPETIKNTCIKKDGKKIPLWECFIKQRNINTPALLSPLLQLIFVHGELKRKPKNGGRERKKMSFFHIPKTLLFFFCSLPADI